MISKRGNVWDLALKQKWVSESSDWEILFQLENQLWSKMRERTCVSPRFWTMYSLAVFDVQWKSHDADEWTVGKLIPDMWRSTESQIWKSKVHLVVISPVQPSSSWFLLILQHAGVQDRLHFLLQCVCRCRSLVKSCPVPSHFAPPPKFRLFWCLFACITGSWRHPFPKQRLPWPAGGRLTLCLSGAVTHQGDVRRQFWVGEEVSPGRWQSYSDFKERPQTSVCCSSSCELSTPAFWLAALFFSFFLKRVRRSTASTPPRSFLLAFFSGARIERSTPAPSYWICGYAKYASQLWALTCGRKTSLTDVGVL